MNSLTYSLIAVVLLLAANAFFVAAEFALVKVRGFQLDQAVTQQRRAAVLSARMHNNLDAYLAACQLGITMASLGLGWVGEPAVATLLEPLLSKFGVTGPALHTISFHCWLPDLLVAAHRRGRTGAEDLRDSQTDAGDFGVGLSTALVLLARVSTQLAIGSCQRGNP